MDGDPQSTGPRALGALRARVQRGEYVVDRAAVAAAIVARLTRPAASERVLVPSQPRGDIRSPAGEGDARRA